jgi:hypothetical protein
MNSSTLDAFQKFSNKDIITIGCEDQLQRRNTLKGLAMQKLVQLAMKSSEEDITIKRLFEQLLDEQSEYFIVDIPFKSKNKYFLRKWSFIHREDFSDFDEFWIRVETIIKEWKVCNYCGLRIKASQQFSRKCRKCNKGWFQSKPDKRFEWELVEKGPSDFILNCLLERGYVKQVQLRKRLDFFHYSNGVFSVYEAKNKELSGLSFRDVQKTLIYPFIIQRSGYPVNELVIVFNGHIKDELLRKIRQGFGYNFTFKIKLWPVKQFLQFNNVHVKGVIINQVTNSYTYDIIYGDSNKIIIDLRRLEISD